jgi:heme-degrading monooxygenase HmoA
MTTIGMRYEVKPGKEEEFERGFMSVLEVLKTLPGHVESYLYEDVASMGSYMIMSRWASKADYEAFLRSEAFKSAVAWGKAEILRSRPKHQVYKDDEEAAAGRPASPASSAHGSAGGGRPQ